VRVGIDEGEEGGKVRLAGGQEGHCDSGQSRWMTLQENLKGSSHVSKVYIILSYQGGSTQMHVHTQTDKAR
jgi:hypothetical protein